MLDELKEEERVRKEIEELNSYYQRYGSHRDAKEPDTAPISSEPQTTGVIAGVPVKAASKEETFYTNLDDKENTRKSPA